MSEIFTGHCPYCGLKLEYDKKDQTISCPACDSSVDVSQLGGGKAFGASAIGGGVSALAMATGFDNPESGVVFLENFFETYDWSEYKESEELELKAISEVVQNNKMKNGAAGESWYLDFKSVSVPVAKKFEGLKEMAKKIGDNYDPEDDADSYATFDTYRRVNAMLIENKDAVVKYLTTAISYAERFHLPAAKLAEIKTELESVKRLYATAKEVKEISEVPEYVQAQKAIDFKKSEEFAKRNIDAKAVYDAAVNEYAEAGNNKSSALVKFETVRGYSDSVKYIKSINKYFNFNGEMFRLFGRYYIYKEEEFSLATLDIAGLGKKKKKKDEPAEGEEAVSALSLYEVVNGVPAEKPLIKGIEQILTCYNNKLYFFKKNLGICSYDLFADNEVILDRGKDEDYCKQGKLFEVALVCNETAIVVKKKLTADGKKGCFGLIKGKTQETARLNNYCLLLVDMKTNSSKVIAPELVDIVDHYGDKVFYLHATKEVNKPSFIDGCLGKKTEITPHTSLMVCDLQTGENKQVLSEACEIHAVDGNRIVYSLWKPNAYNRDLHVYDLKSEKDALIEDNIFGYFKIIGDRIYYTIGNDTYCPLMSNNFDGTDRKEIMQNVERIVDSRAGWLYLKKGWGRNVVLVKVKPDDIDNRIVVCTNFKEVQKFGSGHIHYLDSYNTLRVVRTDGKEDREIAKNVKWSIIEDDYIYYVRVEKVEAKENAMSLYKMDKTGHNVKKLVFNIDDAINYDETTLYYKKEEDVRFEVIKPTAKKKDAPIYETYHVKRFFKFDKATDKSEVVLTLGLPSGKESIKKGCFGKASDADIIYNEVPIVREYKPKGLKAMGAVEEEQTKEKNQETIAKIQEKLPAGCAGFLDKIKGRLPKNPNNASVGRSTSSMSGTGKSKKFSIGAILMVYFALAFLGGALSMIILLASGEIDMPPGPLVIMTLVAALFALYCAGKLPKRPKPGKHVRFCKLSSGIAAILLAFTFIGISDFFYGCDRGFGKGCDMSDCSIGCGESEGGPAEKQPYGTDYSTAEYIPLNETVSKSHHQYEGLGMYYSFPLDGNTTYRINVDSDGYYLSCSLYDNYRSHLRTTEGEDVEMEFTSYQSGTYYLVIYCNDVNATYNITIRALDAWDLAEEIPAGEWKSSYSNEAIYKIRSEEDGSWNIESSGDGQMWIHICNENRQKLCSWQIGNGMEPIETYLHAGISYIVIENPESVGVEWKLVPLLGTSEAYARTLTEGETSITLNSSNPTYFKMDSSSGSHTYRFDNWSSTGYTVRIFNSNGTVETKNVTANNWETFTYYNYTGYMTMYMEITPWSYVETIWFSFSETN